MVVWSTTKYLLETKAWPVPYTGKCICQNRACQEQKIQQTLSIHSASIFNIYQIKYTFITFSICISYKNTNTCAAYIWSKSLFYVLLLILIEIFQFQFLVSVQSSSSLIRSNQFSNYRFSRDSPSVKWKPTQPVKNIKSSQIYLILSHKRNLL